MADLRADFRFRIFAWFLREYSPLSPSALLRHSTFFPSLPFHILLLLRLPTTVTIARDRLLIELPLLYSSYFYPKLTYLRFCANEPFDYASLQETRSSSRGRNWICKTSLQFSPRSAPPSLELSYSVVTRSCSSVTSTWLSFMVSTPPSGSRGNKVLSSQMERRSPSEADELTSYPAQTAIFYLWFEAFPIVFTE